MGCSRRCPFLCCKYFCSALAIPVLAAVVYSAGSQARTSLLSLYGKLTYECVCRAFQADAPRAPDQFSGLPVVSNLGGNDPFIEDLIAKMTPEEKTGQLEIIVDAARGLDLMSINPMVQEGGKQGIMALIRRSKLGAIFNGAGVKIGRELQRVAVEESRLGIPLLFGADVIHGFRTQFPIPLGEAASFEPDLARRTARATAVETTAAGIHWTFAPMVDVARDQRWGRCCESSGEDVFLGVQFAIARVQGFQGPNLTAHDSLLACPKHFAAYGGVAGGMDYNYVEISEAALRDIHLPAFKAALDAGAITLMSAFNDIGGVPASGNRWLMTELLRREWGFKGFVVSDFTADKELIEHGYAADDVDAAKKAFLAGVDMSMMSYIYGYLKDLVAKGEVPAEALDEGVRRVLSVKKAIGLFDDPYRSLNESREADASHLPAHAALSREAGRRSIVLLKNDGGVLPLSRSDKQRIALVGPFGPDRDNIEGCWALFGDKSLEVDIEAGIRAAMPDPSLLEVARGCDAETPIEGGVRDAVLAAQRADVVLLAVGEPQDFSGEAKSQTDIVIPPMQQHLADEVAKAGKPVVVLLKTGRALALRGSVLGAGAILVTWFIGAQTGNAIADVLFGDYSPSGRLPVSFPQEPGQQPYFYSHPRTGRGDQPGLAEEAFKARWHRTTNYPRFPFGHGLSYTTFHYGAPVLSASHVCWEGGALNVTATVRNTGARAGEEVVQLYVHDRVASRVRPKRELKGFRKLYFAPGESKEVTFALAMSALAFHGVDAKPVVEPGVFDVWVAPSALEGTAVSFELLPPGVRAAGASAPTE